MPRLILTNRDLKSILANRDLKLELSSKLLTASAALDPDTQNRYFRSGHEATLTDLHLFSYSKILGRYENEEGVVVEATPESFSFTDNNAISFSKPTSDTFGFSESVLTQITFYRTFTDAFALDDITAVDAVIKDVASAKVNLLGFSDDQAIGIGKGLSDTQSFSDAVDSTAVGKAIADTQAMTETHATAMSLAKSDLFSMAEAASSLLAKPLAEAIPLSDSLERVVTYNRSLTDAFSLDDAATVNALVKDYANAKTNVFGFSDEQAFTFSKTLPTDTFFFADAEEFAFGKGLSDSVSITENFSFALFTDAAMNAAQLNSSPFNE